MKVLHVADTIDPSLGGGVAERTFQLALALRRVNVNCTVLCTDMGLTDKRKAELQDVELIAVPTLLRRFLIPQISSKRIESLVAESDIVHITGHWSVLGARVSLAALRQGKPYVYCPAGSLRIFGRSSLVKRFYNYVVGQRIVSSASYCLAVTELEREQFHEYGVTDLRISLLPNGVHAATDIVAAPQDFRRRYGLDGKQIILFLGRLSPIKGADILLEAFAKIAMQHDTFQLVFAGPDAELGEALKEKVRLAGLSNRVLFTGFLTGQDKQDALTAADMLVVPSRQEAMSLVALEAGLCGTPVLLTDKCGFNEVQSGGGGYVVSVDAQAIADGICRMLKDSETLHLQGERLRELVLSHYTWDGSTQRVLRLYGEVIRKS